MSQLGSGSGTSYPGTIDTSQVFQNVPNPAPDSNTRLDSEFLNDSLAAIVTIEETLGANVQGSYGSLAARLDALLPTTVTVPNVIFFTNTATVTIPGTQHELGTSAILFQVYDSATPGASIQPSSITVHPSTFDVVLTFAFPQSGMAVLGATAPQYATTFSNQTTLTIPGATHALGTGRLLWQLYDGASPRNVMQPSTLTIDQSTFAVVVSFAFPQSGTLVLNAGTPRYELPFTNQTTLTVLGATHGLATQHLLWGLFDTGTPAAAIQPSAVTVHPSTFDVLVSFAVPQSGLLVLASADPPASVLMQMFGVQRLSPKAVLVADTQTLMLTLRQMLQRLMRLEQAYAALQAPASSPQEGAP